MKKISFVLMLFILSLCSICVAKDVPLNDNTTVEMYRENHNIRATMFKEDHYIITGIEKRNDNNYKAILAGSNNMAILFNNNDNDQIMQINYCVKKNTVINGRGTKDILMDLSAGIGCFLYGGPMNMDELKEISSNLTSDMFMAIYMERQVTRDIKNLNRKYIFTPAMMGDYIILSIWAVDK